MVNKEFLKNYTPAIFGFTSNKEMELIENELNLNNKNAEELISVRNEVVQYYSNEMEHESPLSARQYNLMESMQSITAVIDNIYYRI